MPFPLPHSDSGSAISVLSAPSASNLSPAVSFRTLDCELSTEDCQLPLTPIIPAHTRPPGWGGIYRFPGPTTPSTAPSPTLSSRPEWPTFSSVRAARTSATEWRDRGNQPLSNANRWRARNLERRIRKWPVYHVYTSPAPPVFSAPALRIFWNAESGNTNRNSSTASRRNTMLCGWFISSRMVSPSRQSAAKSKSKAGGVRKNWH